ncbi:hypothetical protein N3K66_007885 [Trichothecium roseum]|uniref:Uncharacterized protein n=1 Tax=Trichothecium roseum TaxID=47278 RepID=A0ACC0URY9_9HYPO|nr:hypothetical protein N3K66_007885 [Trichothecium roseum]
MPFVANTPESLLNRGDSKNPNSTCRGITSNGRPCRRALDKPPVHTYGRRPRTPDAPRDDSQFCWQHRDQANVSAHSSPGPRANATPILEEEPRTSLDTLADRLGLVDLQEKHGNGRRRMDTRPPRPNRPLPGPEKRSGLSKLCCCFSAPEEDYPLPAPRPNRPQPVPVQQNQQRPSTQHSNGGRRPSSSQQHGNLPAPSPAKSARSNRSATSQTAQMKDLIPDTLDAATASALLNELSRPYVDSEEEGYIYMFWLTPAASASAPPVDAARSLLAPPSANPRSRRASDAVSSYASSRVKGNSKKTMVLKIGRAANVQRRMNQWQRQCGRDIEVLRFYPYSPSGGNNGSANSSSSGHANSGLVAGRKTPHAHRVERLIHIELSGMGYRVEGKKACEACGKEHREWFEIDATREAIREVDGIIRRWVEMDEASLKR